MRFTRLEQETTVVMNAEEATAEVFTADPVYLRKLKKLHEEFPDTYIQNSLNQDSDDTILSATYTVPKKFIRFGKPASAARIAAGQQAAERMRLKLLDFWKNNSINHNQANRRYPAKGA